MARRILLLEKCPNGTLSKENMFYHLVSDVEIKIDKNQYPNSIFFFKRDAVLFEQDLKYDYLWCNYDLYWEIFEEIYKINYKEIELLTAKMFEKYFKIKTLNIDEFNDEFNYEIKQHFNNI